MTGRWVLATICTAAAIALAILVWRGEMALAALVAPGLAVLVSASTRASPRPVQPARETREEARAASAAVYPEPVILVDRRSIVVDLNDEARTMLPALQLRQPLAFALRDPAVLDAIPSVVATGEASLVEIGGRTSSDPAYEIRLRRLRNDAVPELGEAAVALFFRDLSAERRIETMRVDFIANVSHELRTPLATLAGFIETLQGPAREDSAARERFLTIMAGQAGRMRRLIDDLLQLSRVELKEHLPPVELVDLVVTLAHMVDVMSPLARDRGVEVLVRRSEGPVLVRGDRDELLRLIENLVENAIKYGGQGGPVEVAVGPGASGRGAELSVRDHGPGIAPEHLPRLTERFYRVDVGESRAQGGTGLGLAIVKHIAARHRARLSIDSEPGLGATFRVVFPPIGDT